MEIKLIAKSPIAHGAFTEGVGSGNIAEFRKVPVMFKGKRIDIPTISGNAVRGVIRRELAREFFEKNKAIIDALSDKEFDKLYAVLGNGGALGSNLSTTVDPNAIRNIRKHLPILSLLGSSCYKYMINGMCNIGFFKLNCAELETGDTRLNDLLDEISETRHVDKNIINAEEAGIKPMPYVTEVVIEGSTFTGSISFAPMATEVERACLAHGFNLLNHVGGKRGRGYGEIAVETEEPFDDTAYLQAMCDVDADFVKKFIGDIS